MQIHIHTNSFVLFSLFILFRIRRFPGMKETQLTADVELLPTATVETSKSKQQTRPPISMNFEVITNFKQHDWSDLRNLTSDTWNILIS